MCFYGWYVSNHIKDMLNGPAIIKGKDIKPTWLEKKVAQVLIWRCMEPHKPINAIGWATDQLSRNDSKGIDIVTFQISFV